MTWTCTRISGDRRDQQRRGLASAACGLSHASRKACSPAARQSAVPFGWLSWSTVTASSGIACRNPLMLISRTTQSSWSDTRRRPSWQFPAHAGSVAIEDWGFAASLAEAVMALRGTEVESEEFDFGGRRAPVVRLRDDAIHAPNERFCPPDLFRGTEACIELYWCLGHGWRAGQDRPSSGFHGRLARG